MERKKLLIFGTGMMAKVARFYFERDSAFRPAAFTVDSRYIRESRFEGLDVVPFERIEESHPPGEFEIFIAIGPSRMNLNRRSKFEDAKRKGYRLASYVSPLSVCSSPVGENGFVADRVVIAPFVSVGANCVIFDSCVLSNDCIVEDHCYISPGALISTLSRIGENSIVGAGAIVKTGVQVAKKTLVGAGCYVSKDTAEQGVYGEKSSQLYGCISEKVDISL